MKKRLLSIILALCMALCLAPAAAFADDGDVAIDNTNFPDANFMAYVAQFDTNSDGILSAAEIAAVTSINCSEKSIADLTGIEYFTALTSLNCSSNLLTSLDVSNNTALVELNCSNNSDAYINGSGNQLTTLDVSSNTALTKLICYRNQLTALDVTSNTVLDTLYCQDNQLTSLDVSKNTDLTYLSCSGNQLISLDVSKNTALTFLDCSGNVFTSLNVSKNTALTELHCDYSKVTTLDVSSNTALTKLYCIGGELTSLNVSNNPNLTLLSCHNNLLTTLDVSNCPALTYLSCGNDLTHRHYRNYNQLTSLDVSNNTALTHLNCDLGKLTSLDVSKNTALTRLECAQNQLTSLDVSKNTALTWLDCSQNQLTSLDLSANSSLGMSQLISSTNEYTITLSESRTFDLSTLPGNFNTNLASNWNGGSVSEKFLTVDEGVDKITYTYDLGNGINETFTLNIPSHNHAYGAWSYNETNHWHECTDADCPDKTAGVKDTAAHIYDSDSDVDCNICGYVRTIKNTYDIIEGANSDWASTSGNTLTFRANGDFSKFTGVMIDGALLSTDNYTAVSGSTIITLKAEYLATLSVGTHTLTVVYNDGECGTSFTVKAKENTDNSTSTTTITATDKTNPSTGAIYGSAKAIQSESQNNAVILLAVITLAACGAVSGIVILFIKKKKCNK